MTDWKQRLAIISDEADNSFARAVEICLPLGIHAYELRKLDSGRFPYVTDDAILQVNKIVNTHDLKLIGVSPGFFKDTLDHPTTPETFQNGFSEAFRLMDKLNVRRMTVFTFKREGGRNVAIPDQALDHLRQAVDLCLSEGVELILENSASSWGDTGKNLAYIAKSLGIGVTWDPGNATASGEVPYPDGYQHVRDHIVHVHFKNWLPEQGNVAIQDGLADLVGQVKALQADGYTGYYCVEPHQWHDRENAVIKNTQQLLQLLNSE
jgi:sugar phosphate isomerase/epimerase